MEWFLLGLLGVASSAPLAPNAIMGGVAVAAGNLPWVVNRNLKCGGSLIASQWILTAGHCAFEVGDLVALNQISLDGSHNAEFISVSASFAHPKFQKSTTAEENDIRLVRLSSPSRVAPARIATVEEAALFEAPGTVLTVAGWGATKEGGEVVTSLREVQLPVIANSVCADADHYMTIRLIYDSMMCAGYPEGGKDACAGDSGSPLFTEVAGQGVILGVTSWGVGCGRPDRPGVYTRVSKYRDWIASVLNNTYIPPAVPLYPPSTDSSSLSSSYSSVSSSTSTSPPFSSSFPITSNAEVTTATSSATISSSPAVSEVAISLSDLPSAAFGVPSPTASLVQLRPISPILPVKAPTPITVASGLLSSNNYYPPVRTTAASALPPATRYSLPPTRSPPSIARYTSPQFQELSPKYGPPPTPISYAIRPQKALSDPSPPVRTGYTAQLPAYTLQSSSLQYPSSSSSSLQSPASKSSVQASSLQSSSLQSSLKSSSLQTTPLGSSLQSSSLQSPSLQSSSLHSSSLPSSSAPLQSSSVQSSLQTSLQPSSSQSSSSQASSLQASSLQSSSLSSLQSLQSSLQPQSVPLQSSSLQSSSQALPLQSSSLQSQSSSQPSTPSGPSDFKSPYFSSFEPERDEGDLLTGFSFPTLSAQAEFASSTAVLTKSADTPGSSVSATPAAFTASTATTAPAASAFTANAATTATAPVFTSSALATAYTTNAATTTPAFTSSAAPATAYSTNTATTTTTPAFTSSAPATTYSTNAAMTTPVFTSSAAPVTTAPALTSSAAPATAFTSSVAAATTAATRPSNVPLFFPSTLEGSFTGSTSSPPQFQNKNNNNDDDDDDDDFRGNTFQLRGGHGYAQQYGRDDRGKRRPSSGLADNRRGGGRG